MLKNPNFERLTRKRGACLPTPKRKRKKAGKEWPKNMVSQRPRADNISSWRSTILNAADSLSKIRQS